MQHNRINTAQHNRIMEAEPGRGEGRHAGVFRPAAGIAAPCRPAWCSDTSFRLHSSLNMDGNGRVGRFLMNTMMASGGYPWTVIPVIDRNAYVNALEKASVGEDIAPFADFLARLVKKRLAGEPLPAVPKALP